MRKIIMFNMVSVDGYFAGSDGNIDWHVVDEEFNEYAIENLENIDTIVFGRVTYDIFKDYWPEALTDPASSANERIIAKCIDDAHKVVFSKSESSSDWKNSEFHPEIDADFVKQLKAEPGKDIVIYGSGTVVQQLTDLGLIDVYSLIVNPIILGEGKLLFANVKQRHKLKHANTRVFGNGNVLLQYKA